jgi:site-specific DNA-cytosine methylase
LKKRFRKKVKFSHINQPTESICLEFQFLLMRSLRAQSETSQIRFLELFAGIGGLSALVPSANIAGAIEIDQTANAVYQQNFDRECHTLELASVSHALLAGFCADVWWLSPPCTPFTRRGARRDLSDSRNAALLSLIEAIEVIQPTTVLLENVVGFEISETLGLFRKRLEVVGYDLHVLNICPSQFGWPNRRPRIYVWATRERLPEFLPLPCLQISLEQVLQSAPPLDSESMQSLRIGDQIWQQYQRAMHVVSRDDPQAVTACFTHAYGRSLIRSGSYLRDGDCLRRFSPAEVATLLGFPATWRWPATLSNRQRWRLLGNSLSLPVVRYLLSHLD